MYDEFDDFEEKSPLDQWKEYKEEGGFYDYCQWLEENGYMKVEEWAPIPEFEGYYEASDVGRIKNAWTGKVIKQGTNKKGYKIVSLKVLDQKCTREVHRLVASAFIEGDHTGMDVHHKDSNKANNRLSNLEYCTRKEHVKHGMENGTFSFNNFGKNGVKLKCLNNGKIYDSMRECGRDLGLDYELISQYLRGRIKTCKGYQFEKVD